MLASKWGKYLLHPCSVCSIRIALFTIAISIEIIVKLFKWPRNSLLQSATMNRFAILSAYYNMLYNNYSFSLCYKIGFSKWDGHLQCRQEQIFISMALRSTLKHLSLPLSFVFHIFNSTIYKTVPHSSIQPFTLSFSIHFCKHKHYSYI